MNSGSDPRDGRVDSVEGCDPIRERFGEQTLEVFGTPAAHPKRGGGDSMARWLIFWAGPRSMWWQGAAHVTRNVAGRGRGKSTIYWLPKFSQNMNLHTGHRRPGVSASCICPPCAPPPCAPRHDIVCPAQQHAAAGQATGQAAAPPAIMPLPTAATASGVSAGAGHVRLALSLPRFVRVCM